ncbi:hypothetical protein X777_09075 [Ooceraea biroi]|uniref:Uncharacterized protein n=1 Tax=Ooceraea biroi TaxID=2015173 RepID=A0A026W7J3_OOCBI|nr:hypothetical protein X777_09075 [Ooceraea biroi]
MTGYEDGKEGERPPTTTTANEDDGRRPLRRRNRRGRRKKGKIEKESARERERGEQDLSRGANIPSRVDFWAAPNIFLIKSIAVTRG